MKRRDIFFLLLSFFLLPLCAEVKILSTAGKGVLLEKDGHQILLLQGEPYEMGYQHGVLMKEALKEMVDKALAISFARHPGMLKKAWEEASPFIPSRYLEEMKGMADGSGIPLEKVQMANIFPELFHCSGMAFWGKATQNGELIHGRILDYMTLPNFQKHALVMVFKPDNFHAFMTAGFAGFIGSVTGMNEKKVAIGEMGGKGFGKWKGIPMSLLVRKVLEEADTLEEAVRIFEESPRTCEYYYIISDGNRPEAVAMRAVPEKVEVGRGGESHPLLPAPFPKDTVFISGGDRYFKLMKRVKKFYGRINLETVKEIMKRPVAMESNLHNAIFLPESLKMYLALALHPSQPCYQACFQEYVEYDMKELFKYFPSSLYPGTGAVNRRIFANWKCKNTTEKR